ncbi:uncharacterized protein IL334_001950 [Kwoniella shivajii]|uniref:SH3 domain-containing protein n=1 Tax=Kwoniella shivajii TaxID=564305 RepID=A0ABZ1CUJ4_9TREE|nr:hypothetical protein IL334_001950 [Kwoniella shivajii]
MSQISLQAGQPKDEAVKPSILGQEAATHGASSPLSDEEAKTLPGPASCLSNKNSSSYAKPSKIMATNTTTEPESSDPSASPMISLTPSHSEYAILSSPQPSSAKRHSTTSSLQSSRPAPASPASSRPPSTILDPSVSSSYARDRSASTSSRGGRRISSSSSSSAARGQRSRASSKVRPKSTLGSNILLPETPTTPAGIIAKNPIPEHPTTQTSIEQTKDEESQNIDSPLPQVSIRDFAFEPSDERYHGRGVLEEDSRASSGSGGFKWPWKGDDGNQGESSGGWGGFGFLGGWRNRSPTQKEFQGQYDNNDDGDEDDDGDFLEGEEQDEYYSSPAQSDSGETFGYSYNVLPPVDEDVEPKGYYRAAYAFEAISSSEMNLTEGDLVSLAGRGNGDPGWVIARRVRVLGGKIAGIDEIIGLVPESYLERVEVIENN